MKIPVLFIYALMLSFPAIIFSCKKSKHCATTSSDAFPPFPYSPGQKIVFRDTLSNEISVTMISEIQNDSEYDLTTRNGYGNPTGYEYCGMRSQLWSLKGTSTDSMLNQKWAKISVTYDKFVEGPDVNQINFAISAFNNVYIHGIMDRNGTKTFNNSSFLSSFETPYKKYQKVYKFQPAAGSLANGNSFIFDDNGRVLSFNVKSDTLRFYYLVE